MKRLLVAAFLVLALGGMTCSNDQGIALMNGCAAAEQGLKFATALKAQGKLSAVQIARIDLVVNSVTPICGAEAIVNPSAALDILEMQLLTLNGVILEPGSNN
jgi:hypothetical protein